MKEFALFGFNANIQGSEMIGIALGPQYALHSFIFYKSLIGDS
jgi:hypothetical protein